MYKYHIFHVISLVFYILHSIRYLHVYIELTFVGEGGTESEFFVILQEDSSGDWKTYMQSMHSSSHKEYNAPAAPMCHFVVFVPWICN